MIPIDIRAFAELYPGEDVAVTLRMGLTIERAKILLADLDRAIRNAEGERIKQLPRKAQS